MPDQLIMFATLILGIGVGGILVAIASIVLEWIISK